MGSTTASNSRGPELDSRSKIRHAEVLRAVPQSLSGNDVIPRICDELFPPNNSVTVREVSVENGHAG